MLERSRNPPCGGTCAARSCWTSGCAIWGWRARRWYGRSEAWSGAQGMMGATCGALTAAACLIAFGGHGRIDRDRVYMLIQELEERFNEELVSQYPGNHCDDLLESDPEKVPTQICPPVIAGAIRIALELLEGEGLEITA
ncbi:MAG: C-GCAxxG-C-C family protein [bacterium]